MTPFGGVGCGARGFGLVSRAPGRPRVTVRPNYVGPPPVGLDAGRMNGGESCRDQVGQRAPVRPRKYGPEEPKVAAVKRRKARRPA